MGGGGEMEGSNRFAVLLCEEYSVFLKIYSEDMLRVSQEPYRLWIIVAALQKAELASYMMEGRRIFAGTFLVIFLLIGFTRAQDALKEKGIKDPRAHPNLAPFEQWRSAYDCLQNFSQTSTSCPEKYQLTAKGWVNVTKGDTGLYCDECKDHTIIVLACLEDVMRTEHYKFESGEKVADISLTITDGCLKGFTGEALHASNARTLLGSKIATYISVLAAWLFVTYMTM